MSSVTTHDLFLSYASSDRQAALAVADTLEAEDLRVWVDRRGISGGEQWAAEITTAIWESKAVVILCSQASVSSRNVRQELQLAWDFDRPIIPLLLEAVTFPADTAYFLHGRQWIDMSATSDSDWVRRLKQSVEDLDAGQNGRAERPAQSATVTHSHLPEPPTAMVGRVREQREAIALFRDGARLVTFTGPGGVGKTRLSLAVARKLAEQEEADAYFVDLSQVFEPDVVVTTVAAAIGVETTEDRTPVEGLIRLLHTRRLVLALDNFEQVVSAAPIVAQLLAGCPALRVVITSRQPLHIRAERELAIEPFTVPGASRAISVDGWESEDAIALFVHRAQAVRPHFTPTSESIGAITEICRRLEGMPLAIELAAARVRILSPAALLERLDDRLGFLNSGAVDAPDRQRTLWDTINWSFELLDSNQQMTFCWLSVFSGGFALETADTVVGPVEGADMFDLVSSLLEQSLIRQLSSESDGPRFGMLETVREFAFEQLTARGQADLARARHADAFTGVAERLSLQSEGIERRTGEGSEWYAKGIRAWDQEIENLRAAWLWHDQHGNAQDVLQIIGAARSYWKVRPFVREVVPLLRDNMLRSGDEVPASIRIRAGLTLAFMLAWTGETDEGFAVANAASQLASESGDSFSMGLGQIVIGMLWERLGSCEASLTAYQRAADLLQDQRDQAHYGLAQGELGDRMLICGDVDEGVRLIDLALQTNRRTGYLIGVALNAGRRAHAALIKHDVALARSLFGECLRQARALGDERIMLGAAMGFAALAFAEGDADGAARLIGAVDDANQRRYSGQSIPFGLHNARLRQRLEEALGSEMLAQRANEGRAQGYKALIGEVPLVA